jgi:hypothetical protein
MHELNEIYNEIKNSIGYFVKLVRLAKKEHLTLEEVIGFINMSNDIQDLKIHYKQLNVGMVELESKLYAKKEELRKLDGQITKATNLIEIKSEIIERKSQILTHLISQKQKLEQYMEYIKSSQNYKEIEQITANKVTELLSDNKQLLDYAFISVVTVLRSDSDKRFLFETLQSSFFSYPSIIDNKSFWESKRPAGEEQFVKERVLEDANRILEWLKKGIVDTTIAGFDKDASSTHLALPYYESS